MENKKDTETWNIIVPNIECQRWTVSHGIAMADMLCGDTMKRCTKENCLIKGDNNGTQ